MTDLDFDELDKAVNSLMKGAPVKKEPTLTEEQTLTIKPTLPENSRPPLESLNAAIANTTHPSVESPSASLINEAPASTAAMQPSVASRRGRFMDMVRPAAASSSPVPLSRTSSRQGLTIEPKGPLVTDIKPATASQLLSTAMPTPTEASPPVSDVLPPKQSEKTDWPDPLEMIDYEDTPPVVNKKHASLDEDELAKGISTLQSDSEPLLSPFLPDTKVEKRPLGGSISTAIPEELEQKVQPSEVSSDVVSDQLPANPADARPELPEELSTDLMALESDANTIAVPVGEAKSDAVVQATQPPKVEPSVEQPPKPLIVEDESKAEKEVPVESPRQAPAPSHSIAPDHTLPAGPISIPQQYREEPSTGDQNNGAIYDTDAYHQPLAHPKKKKSGWVWVVWTALFLALGAAGGAALYFLGVF